MSDAAALRMRADILDQQAAELLAHDPGDTDTHAAWLAANPTGQWSNVMRAAAHHRAVSDAVAVLNAAAALLRDQADAL